jgi:hypothetical protein
MWNIYFMNRTTDFNSWGLKMFLYGRSMRWKYFKKFYSNLKDHLASLYLKIHPRNVYHYSVLKGGAWTKSYHYFYFIRICLRAYIISWICIFMFCRSLFVLLLLAFVLCVLLRFTDSGYLQTLLSSLHIFSIS